MLLWKLQRETKLKTTNPPLLFPHNTMPVERRGQWNPQGSVFSPLRWLKVTWTPFSDFSISDSHAIVTQNGRGCHSLILNYKIAQKCIFPVYIFCATIWWHIQHKFHQTYCWCKSTSGTQILLKQSPRHF